MIRSIRKRIQVWVAGSALALPLLTAAADNVAMLRVLETSGDTFDYTFTTYTPAADGSWILAFNHRSGQTVFARVGERIGTYRLTAFSPDEVNRYDASLNTTRRKKSGQATLTAPDGSSYKLVMNQPYNLSGQRATLIAVPSGSTWNVRTGDAVRVGNSTLTVSEIADTIRLTNATQRDALTIPPLQPDEIEQLRAERQRRLRLAQRASEPVFPKADVPPATDRLVPAHRSWDEYAGALRNLPGKDSRPDIQSRFVVATEYRYPVDYQVLVLQRADGSWQPICLPRRFNTFSGNLRGHDGHGYRKREHRQRHPTTSPFTPPTYLRIPHPDTQKQYFGF